MTVAALIDLLKQMHPDSMVNIDVGYVNGDEHNTRICATRRWIPVTEDLPDSDRDVLIAVKGRWAPEIGYMITVHKPSDFHKEYGVWKACDRDYVFDDGEVVAWMELPPKYGEGQDEREN